AIRFDIFKGPFTQDTTFVVSPFTSGFRYVKDVSYEKAQLIVDILNHQPQILEGFPYQARYPVSTIAFPGQPTYFEDTLVDDGAVFDREEAPERRPNQVLLSGNDDPMIQIFPGYTTVDDGGTDGDDTIHSRI